MAETKDRGAAAIEYGIMLAAIAAIIVLTVFGLGIKTASGLTSVLNLWP